MWPCSVGGMGQILGSLGESFQKGHDTESDRSRPEAQGALNSRLKPDLSGSRSTELGAAGWNIKTIKNQMKHKTPSRIQTRASIFVINNSF